MRVFLKYRLTSIIVVLCTVFAAFTITVTAKGSKHYIPLPGEAVVPIVMYHEIKQTGLGKLAISPYEFESDLKYFKSEGYTPVVMSDLIDFVYKGKPLPPKPIVITFDDGYYNNYVFAYPLLRKYNVKAVLSVIGKNTDDFTRYPSDNINYAHMTWSQLKELQESGFFEMQNHTYNLHAYASRKGCSKKRGESNETYNKVLSGDVLELQTKMQENIGITPTTFTYPYGDVSKESVPIIKQLGFKASLSCDYGINVIGKKPDGLFCLKRVSRYHKASLKKTLEKAFRTTL